MPNGTQSITDNDHIYIMFKLEERTQEVLLSKLNMEEQAYYAAEKKAYDVELLYRKRSTALETILNDKISEGADKAVCGDDDG